MDDVVEKAFESYRLWLENIDDVELKEELLSLKGNEEEIIDRFYKDFRIWDRRVKREKWCRK